MQVLRGTVVSGKVVVDGAALEEGARVTVLVPEKERPFSTTPGRRARERNRNSSRDDRWFEEAEILRDLGGES
ncbi:MAG: hypothetical protein WEF50_21695 [Myxococcota bacterium]